MMEALEVYEAASKAIDAATGAGASYADVRVIQSQREFLRTKDESVAAINYAESMGLGIRALFNGGWGFAATQSPDNGNVTKAALLAVEVAKASASIMKRPVVLAPEATYQTTWISPHKVDPFTI